MSASADEHFAHEHDRTDIQGGIVGFNKDFQRLVYINLPSQAAGQAFLAEIKPQVATAAEVLEFNDLFKKEAKDGKPSTDLKATWTNVWLSSGGLRQLQPPHLDAFPADFLDGMAAQAQLLGDVARSGSANWVAPFTGGSTPDVIVVIAADFEEDLEAAYGQVQQSMTASGVTELSAPQDGAVLSTGREHFGFKDGISQPGMRGISTPSKTPHDEIATGEFLIGYPDEQGNISGQPMPSPPPPTPYNPNPPAPAPAPMPDWSRNGSFVVYRRLQQDVGAFIGLSGQVPASGLSSDQLAAKLIGRWPSGAPMEHVPGLPKTINPADADPSSTDSKVLDDKHINNFTYNDDAEGTRVPRGAHTRKTNPRSSSLPDGDDSRRHRILRRGIPYGTPFVPGNPPYGPVIDPSEDRGLLFVCYQASIADGFTFIQTNWANAADFQQSGDGEDAIISQNIDPRPYRLPRAGVPPVDLSFNQWVFTTGGGYYFAPSISALTGLAQALADSP